jgi:hypothetical protein
MSASSVNRANGNAAQGRKGRLQVGRIDFGARRHHSAVDDRWPLALLQHGPMSARANGSSRHLFRPSTV